MPTAITAGDAQDQDLDATFAALANGTRRAILARLTQGAATVNEIARPFDLTLPAVSKHIKVLEHAGLVRRSRHAQFRPCVLDPGPLDVVAAWVDEHRATWETSFDRMDAYLASLTTPPPGGTTGGRDDRSPREDET